MGIVGQVHAVLPPGERPLNGLVNIAISWTTKKMHHDQLKRKRFRADWSPLKTEIKKNKESNVNRTEENKHTVLVRKKYQNHCYWKKQKNWTPRKLSKLREPGGNSPGITGTKDRCKGKNKILNNVMHIHGIHWLTVGLGVKYWVVRVRKRPGLELKKKEGNRKTRHKKN